MNTGKREKSDDDAEPADAAAEPAQQQIREALEFYDQFGWARVALWRIEGFQPPQMVQDMDQCDDDTQVALLREFWMDQVNKPLPTREVHYIWAVMGVWALSHKFLRFRDPRLRLHAIYEMLMRSKRMMTQTLLRAPETIGIDPLTKADIAYDPEMESMWDEEAKKVLGEETM